MKNENMQIALNEQITEELASANIYLAMAAWFDAEGLGGFAHWMKMQAKEEQAHAFKFYDYIHDRDGRVVIGAIPAPNNKFESVLDVFEKTLEHEQHISACINNLYGMAMKEGDYASQIFLQWFVQEQVEEEKTVRDVIDVIKRVGNDENALLLEDREMAKRPEPTIA